MSAERGLTLYEWSERHGIDIRTHENGACWVPDCFVEGAVRSALWWLSDYAVFSVRGGTIWLEKRTVR